MLNILRGRYLYTEAFVHLCTGYEIYYNLIGKMDNETKLQYYTILLKCICIVWNRFILTIFLQQKMVRKKRWKPTQNGIFYTSRGVRKNGFDCNYITKLQMLFVCLSVARVRWMECNRRSTRSGWSHHFFLTPIYIQGRRTGLRSGPVKLYYSIGFNC